MYRWICIWFLNVFDLSYSPLSTRFRAPTTINPLGLPAIKGCWLTTARVANNHRPYSMGISALKKWYLQYLGSWHGHWLISINSETRGKILQSPSSLFKYLKKPIVTNHRQLVNPCRCRLVLLSAVEHAFPRATRRWVVVGSSSYGSCMVVLWVYGRWIFWICLE